MSIFSINDNSNYNSILSQAKANKEGVGGKIKCNHRKIK